MGLMASRASGYSNVLMMNTATHIHFKDTLQRQWTTAAAAARMEQNQSVAAANSPGAVPGTARAWGMGFYGISSAVFAFSKLGIPLGFVFIGLAYMMKASHETMAFAIFVATFFVFYFFIYHAPVAQGGLVSGANLLISLVVAGIVGGFVGYFLYEEGVGFTKDITGNQNTVVIPRTTNDTVSTDTAGNPRSYTW